VLAVGQCREGGPGLGPQARRRGAAPDGRGGRPPRQEPPREPPDPRRVRRRAGRPLHQRGHRRGRGVLPEGRRGGPGGRGGSADPRGAPGGPPGGRPGTRGRGPGGGDVDGRGPARRRRPHRHGGQEARDQPVHRVDDARAQSRQAGRQARAAPAPAEGDHGRPGRRPRRAGRRRHHRRGVAADLGPHRPVRTGGPDAVRRHEGASGPRLRHPRPGCLARGVRPGRAAPSIPCSRRRGPPSSSTTRS